MQPIENEHNSRRSPEQIRDRALFMVTVWERMGEMFGQLWESSFGTAEDGAIDTWTRGLADHSETSIRCALDLLKAWTKPFPPSLGEFVALCRSYRPNVSNQLKLSHDHRAPKEVGLAHIELMRRIQRGDYPTDDEIQNALLGKEGES